MKVQIRDKSMSNKNPNEFFSTPTYSNWVELAETTLKGKSVDDLSRINEDGININALYSSSKHSLALSNDLSSKAAGRWVIAQYLEPCETPKSLNAAILDELKGGAEQVIFPRSQTPKIVSESMNDVMADAIKISFEYPQNVSEAFDQIIKIWDEQNTSPELARGSVGADVTPETSVSLCKFIAEHKDILHIYPHLRVVKISGSNANRSGATDAQEIAVILSSFVMLLRDAKDTGLSFAEILNRLEFDFAIEADLYAGIAKARALRSLLDRVINVMGCSCQDLASRLHGITSDRMLSVIDSETNMLRSGTAMLSMALSGIGVITNRPHDWLSGSSTLSRRIARNAHHLLADEAQLTQVADPAQGSYFIDTLTTDIADKSWKLFQDIERVGGIKSATDLIHAWFEDAHANRAHQIENGIDALLGVSIHPVSNTDGMPKIIEENMCANLIMRGGSRRPAAAWENLIREFRKKKFKCLLLDLSTNNSAKSTKRWVDIFGFESASMNVDDANAGVKLINTAKPDLVVLGEGLVISENEISNEITPIVKRSTDFSNNIIDEMSLILKLLEKRLMS